MRGRSEVCGQDCAERPACDLLTCVATCACPTDCGDHDRWENCRHRPRPVAVAVRTAPRI